MHACYPTSPVPAISIDFAPIEDTIPDPPSVLLADDEDGSLRSTHLLPPPAISPRAAEAMQRQIQQQSQALAAGVDRARFELMLQATRDRSAVKKHLDLRKEAVLKAHQSKQAERRAIFLSKIVALPDPTATSTPVTPPETPAVFHFTLPSPGLVSPLALFESLEFTPSTTHVRVEEVDFRARARKDAEAMAAITRNMKQSMEVNGLSGNYQPPKVTSPNVPSLAQISARLNATSNTTTSRAPTTKSRLPAFLRNRDVAAPPLSTPSPTSSDATLRAPVQGVFVPPLLERNTLSTPRSAALPTTARTPTTPTGNTALTAKNLQLLDKRARHGQAMVDKLKRRVSAPAELYSRPETHPILKISGGF